MSEPREQIDKKREWGGERKGKIGKGLEARGKFQLTPWTLLSDCKRVN